MPTTLRHFAINADDVPRAKRFYEGALGLSFAPWGPPDYYLTDRQNASILGALQARRELLPGERASTFETTFGVDDLRATLDAIETHGGRVVVGPYRIDGVGELAYFEDTEGNVSGVMQYEPGFWPE